ncbi:MAG: cytochrome b/b6 domain-containing protein, partial [Coriobacteriia bacterium]|nr:cytochrome b/b6 domain-containing protein [Coriobacteriia bacterium]
MNLVQFNIWLDTIFVIIYVCVWLFLAWHFSMSIIKGRFRKSFIEGHWPEHDSRPPGLPKFIHAQHMFMMILLGISGMYIRFPYFSGGRIAMRYIHYFAMIVVTINLVWRVWYAFWSKARDYKEFAIGKKDVASLGGILKYYGYLSNEKPHVAKYNVAQKAVYDIFLLMMVLMAFTGFALVTPKFIFGYSPRDLL